MGIGIFNEITLCMKGVIINNSEVINVQMT